MKIIIKKLIKFYIKNNIIWFKINEFKLIIKINKRLN